MNPPSKSINVKTQEGLNLLKLKAAYYGHYADNLKVLELIAIAEEVSVLEEYVQQLEYRLSKNQGCD